MTQAKTAAPEALTGYKQGGIATSPRRIGILVLGMHRSGTSAMSRVFNLLGADLPKTLMSGNKTNEKGHWESTPIARLNDRILESAGSSWDDWLSVNPGWFSSPRAEEFRDEALATLESEVGASRLFVLKDPRICRLVPFWVDVLREAGVTPVISIPLRNPLEVAASLEKRNGFDPGLGHLLWLRHVLDAEAATRGLPRFFTTYDQLLDGWEQVAERSQVALGVAWPRLSDRASEEIDAFLDEDHRHHEKAPATVTKNPRLSDWLKRSFEIVDRWSSSGEDKADLVSLDSVRAEFDAAAPAFSRLVSSGRQAMDKAKALEGEIAKTQAKLAALEADLAEQKQALRDAEEKLRIARASQASAEEERDEQAREAEAANRTAAELRDRLAQTESALEQRRHEAEQTAAELANAQASLDALRAEMSNQLEAKERENERLRSETSDARAELEALRSETSAQLDTREQEQEELRAEIGHARSELEALKSETSAQLDAREREQKELKAETTQAQAALDTLKSETSAQLDARKRENERLKSETAQAQAALKALRSETSARIAASDRRIKELQQAAEAERNGKVRAEARLAERFEEIATLTRMLRERNAETGSAQRMADTLKRRVEAIVNDRAWSALPWRVQVWRKMAALRRSGLFDAEWYLKTNPDVAGAGADPLRHYVMFGAEEGRAPNAALTPNSRT